MAGQFRGARALLLCSVLLASVGCAPIKKNHGYVPPPEDLAKVTVGRDTRETVAEAVGAPLNQGLERDDAWYYVSSRRQQVGLLAPVDTERQIVAIRFDNAGRVENIQRFGLEDGRVVTLTTRITDPSVDDIGFLRQVFGNLGSITADRFLN